MCDGLPRLHTIRLTIVEGTALTVSAKNTCIRAEAEFLHIGPGFLNSPCSVLLYWSVSN